MDKLLFSINAVLPIILPILLGFYLKKRNFFGDTFIKQANKLCFRVLIPLLLFDNVYKADLSNINVNLLIFCVAAVIILFILGFIYVKIFVEDNKQKGVVLQSFFRSNYAIIGIPLATLIAGDSAKAEASIISAAIIPLFNIFAVVALTIFDKEENQKISVKALLYKIIKNPLIIGVFSGVIVSMFMRFLDANNIFNGFSSTNFLPNTISSLGKVATPLALIVLGANFKFEDTKAFKGVLTFTVLVRLFIIPTIVMVAGYIFGLRDAVSFAIFIAAFGTPIAVSSSPMAMEMHQDADLAGQIVIWTSVVSAISLFLIIFACGIVGIF